MQAVQRRVVRRAQVSICRHVMMVQRRFVFGFSPTSTPEGLQDYELLYREYEKESIEARKILKTHGYDGLVSMREIDDYPLDMDELRELRHKLKLQFHLWVDPPLFEDFKSSTGIQDALKAIVNGYKKSNNKGRKKANFMDKINKELDEYRIMTPIFYHKKEDRAIIAKPADKLITIIKPSKKEVDKSYYGDEDKRYQVLGTQWHKKGAKFYDNDEGMDWDYVDIKKAEAAQDKKFKDWKDWGEDVYVDENTTTDPNDMDGFAHRSHFFDGINKRRRR